MKHLGRTLILASASVRRRDLLTKAGYDFKVVQSGVQEDAGDTRTPSVLAECLAQAKAQAVADKHKNAVVLGADTLVALGGEIIGKPRNEKHARGILGMLSGTTHEVITGVCLIDSDTGLRVLGHDVTRITMKKITKKQINDYVDSGEALGKAGAYAIQEKGDRFIEKISGSFTNVVGLPMELVAVLIKQLEYRLGRDV